jgi:hypothetical protein
VSNEDQRWGSLWSTDPARSWADHLDIRRGPLYRAFEKRCDAEALVAGRVWVSTLSKCKAIEDPVRQDAGEGMLLYESGEISGPADDPDVRLVAHRSGLSYAPGTVGGTVTVVGNVSITEHRDVYIVCMSTERMTKFGPYCVRINEPWQFINAVGAALVESGKVLQVTSDSPQSNCHFGIVEYRDRRSYRHLDPGLMHAAFVKPAVPFAEDKEVRVIYRPTRLPITPLEVACPEVAALCERLP